MMKIIMRNDVRTNLSIADELGVTLGTLLIFIKKQKLSYFGHIKIQQILEKLILERTVKGQRNRGSWEKDYGGLDGGLVSG